MSDGSTTPVTAPGLGRTISAGLLGGVAWIAAMALFFGLAQSTLFDAGDRDRSATDGPPSVLFRK